MTEIKNAARDIAVSTDGNPFKNEQVQHYDITTFLQLYQAYFGSLAVNDDFVARQLQHYSETLAIREKMGWRSIGGSYIVKVDGICMEGMDVANGDLLLIDSRKYPRQVGDVCAVIADHPAKISYKLEPMIKGYHGCDVGGGHWCREYHTERHNHNVFVRPWAFCGVAFACYTADWRLKWTRDISDWPEELSRKRTLVREPGNCGPMVRITVV